MRLSGTWLLQGPVCVRDRTIVLYQAYLWGQLVIADVRDNLSRWSLRRRKILLTFSTHSQTLSVVLTASWI